MKTHFSFIDPGMIMGLVVSLIILGVGTFALYVTIANINPPAGKGYDDTSNTTNWTRQALSNASASGSQVFNIVGVILIIAAIMSIVGLVYNYVR